MRWYEGMHKTLYPSPASSNSYIVVIGIAMVTGLVPSRPRPDAVVGSVIRQWRWLRAATMRTGARLVAARCLRPIHDVMGWRYVGNMLSCRVRPRELPIRMAHMASPSNLTSCWSHARQLHLVVEPHDEAIVAGRVPQESPRLTPWRR
jgi:hypothetical protein